MSRQTRIAENLAGVRERIAAAARSGGRQPGEITLVAVTKYVHADIARQLMAAGCRELGESRPQELWAKAEALRDPTIRWHMVGHLQRNKVERTLPLVSLIHSGDSLRLFEAVNKAATALGRQMAMLIEVNISGEPTKHGFAPDELEAQLPSVAALSSVEVRGLMTMASGEGDLDQARREFAALRTLRDRLRRTAPPQIGLNELSMGMSGDFEVAIEEGATLVRVGSALFEGIENQSEK